MEEPIVNDRLAADEVVDTEVTSPIVKEKSQGVPGTQMSAENSEYEDADSYSEEEGDAKRRSRSSSSNSDTDGSLILEREEGDGQESIPSKKVDDDEDKKNPQYIPKRGTFYEHDDRTTEDIEAKDKAEVEKDKDGKKKVWQDKKERWTHDKFNDTDQAPKSRAELVAIYGYDIRNEDGPPRARRRRRYGRGPNKYTRTWKDEEAYTKTSPQTRTKKQIRPKKTNEEFPPLFRNSEYNAAQSASEERSIVVPPVTIAKTQEKTDLSKETVNPPTSSENRNQQGANNVIIESHNNRNVQQQSWSGSGRTIKPKREIKDSDHRGFTTKTRQLRNIKPDNQTQKILLPRSKNNEDVIQTQNFTNRKEANNIQELEKEVGKLSIDGNHKGGNKFNNSNNNQRQGSVPPRLQNEQQKGSKRYSSMRQRSLPEANTPPAVPNYQHPTSFYPNEYTQQPPTTTDSQPLFHQPAPIHTTQIPPPTISLAQQVPVPVTAAAVPLQFPVPPNAFPQAPPAAAFLQPGVAPPPFIPPQPQQIINYVQGQPAFTPNYQGYQQQFNPVTQPTELYQPQGGITYYSADQQVAPRPAPQKRPKAAIPIIAPPEERKDGYVVEEYSVPDNSSNATSEIPQ